MRVIDFRYVLDEWPKLILFLNVVREFAQPALLGLVVACCHKDV